MKLKNSKKSKMVRFDMFALVVVGALLGSLITAISMASRISNSIAESQKLVSEYTEGCSGIGVALDVPDLRMAVHSVETDENGVTTHVCRIAYGYHSMYEAVFADLNGNGFRDERRMINYAVKIYVDTMRRAAGQKEGK